MKILIDTNILISTFALEGRVRKIFDALLDTKSEIVITEYVDREFRRVVNQKFSKKAETILAKYEKNNFKIYPSTTEIFGKIRDKKDIPVLSDAIFHEVDILLTGDKDFLESEIKNPLILSPTLLFEYMQR